MKRQLFAPITGRYERLFHDVMQAKSEVEPSWLVEQRQVAFDRLSQVGIPTRHVEAWK